MGLTRKNDYVWWDEFHKDPRKLVSPDKFFKLLKNPYEGVSIVQTDYVPMTVIEVPFHNRIARFFTSIRPATHTELDTYFSGLRESESERNPRLSNAQKESIDPFYTLNTSSLDAKTADKMYFQRLAEVLDNGSFSMPTMFLPHIRGPYVGSLNNGQTQVYTSMDLKERKALGASKQKRSITKKEATELRKALDDNGLDFIHLLNYKIKVHDRMKRLYPRLYSKGIIGSSKNYGVESIIDTEYEQRLMKKTPESFYHMDLDTSSLQQVPYYEFKEYHKQGTPVFSYVPIRIDVYEQEPQTYPFLLTNNPTMDRKEPVLLGLYSGKNSRQKGSGRLDPNSISVLSIIDEDFALRAAKSIQDQLGLRSHPLIKEVGSGSKGPSYTFLQE